MEGLTQMMMILMVGVLGNIKIKYKSLVKNIFYLLMFNYFTKLQ